MRERERESLTHETNPAGITPWIRSPYKAELDKECRKLQDDCESLKVSCLPRSLARSLTLSLLSLLSPLPPILSTLYTSLEARIPRGFKGAPKTYPIRQGHLSQEAHLTG